MWSQTVFAILPFVALIFFLLSIYGHKIEIKKLNKKIQILENQEVYNSYTFTEMNLENDDKKRRR